MRPKKTQNTNNKTIDTKNTIKNTTKNTNNNDDNERIIQQEYSEVMRKSYIDYAMSVITARALPDVRDGLKPVQRRILYDMEQLKTDFDKPYKKSARIVGDTMGKYHPHGDSSIYEALVVMAQDFKKNQILVDGHGNFGSIEGDGAAAMRYTESRLTEFSQEVYLSDLDKNIVDFMPNFDGSEKEPVVLPVKVPNLLINGMDGIAVGMTTNIPPHNLGEVIDACIAYLSKEKITNKELLNYCKGPDFPTGGIIANKKDLLNIYETGSGKLRLRGKLKIEKAKGKEKYDKLVITEIPYTMIGSGIGAFISDVVKLAEAKVTTDIVDISNESSKDGIRIVLHIKKTADVENLKNLLYKKTKLEDTFGVNMLAIVDNKPEILSLRDIIAEHIKFRYELETRKYNNLLEKELINKEIKEGLIKACNMIDVIIEVLRGSKNLKIAKNCLMTGNTDGINFRTKGNKTKAEKMNFTEVQANAILDMRLAKLIGLEIDLLNKEYNSCIRTIERYKKILSDKKEMKKVIKEEYRKIKEKYERPRRTALEDQSEATFVEKENEPINVVFTMNKFGYIKLLEQNIYDKNEDAIKNESKYILKSLSSDRVCVFTDAGNMYSLKLEELPLLKAKDKGVMIDSLSKFDSKNENIIYINLLSDIINKKLLFITKNGFIKKVDGSEFDVIKRIVASTKLNDKDKILKIETLTLDETRETKNGTHETCETKINTKTKKKTETEGVKTNVKAKVKDNNKNNNKNSSYIIIMTTHQNNQIAFPVDEIPELKKTSVGVKGIKLKESKAEDDYDNNYDYVEDIRIVDIKEAKKEKISVQKRGGTGKSVKM